VIDEALEATEEWNRGGWGPYKVLVGRLTLEAQLPERAYSLVPLLKARLGRSAAQEGGGRGGGRLLAGLPLVLRFLRLWTRRGFRAQAEAPPCCGSQEKEGGAPWKTISWLVPTKRTRERQGRSAPRAEERPPPTC